MLTKEEEQHKDEIIKVTEEVLDAKGIECDARIAKISEDDLREILEEVRRIRKKRKRFEHDEKSTEESEVERQEQEEEEAPYIR